MSTSKCKGGCGSAATYKGWCRIKWKSGKKFGVYCPVIVKKISLAISKFRLEEAKKGKNPMQNPEICAKNHSPERAKKLSKIMKDRGKKGLLPQQTESQEKKDLRRSRVSRSLRRLLKNGKHPRQLETPEQLRKRMEKVSKTLSERYALGEIEPNYSGTRVEYKGISFRSKWEKETAKFLDTFGFNWEYETMRVPYWDTERKRQANTVPDFFLPEPQIFIEVKGRWLETTKTKDKIRGIFAQGYPVVLIGETQIELMRKKPYEVIKLIEKAEL